MAKLPGLTSHTDDAITSRSGGRSSQGRVVVNAQGARSPGLTPQAAPVDTYFRPAQAPQDNNLANMAESLAALNPSLMRYAAVRKETQDETLSARVAQRYAGKSTTERAELYKNDPDAQTLLGKRAIAANMGRADASEAARLAAEHYETQFDKDGGDLDGYLNGVMRQAIDAHPEDPFYAEQFAEVFGPMAGSIRSEHTKYRVGRTQEKVAETVHNSWLGTVQSGILKGEDPMAIAATIRGSYETNKQGLKMSFPDQDKAVVGVIQQLTLQMDQEPGNAEKIMGVIQALAVEDRTAADGTKMGRLLDSGALGPDVAKLLSAAETKLTNVRELDNYKAIDDFTIQAENGKLDPEALDGFFNDPKKKGVLTDARRASLLAMDRTAKEQAAKELLKQAEKDRVRADVNAINGDAVAAADEGRLSWLEDRDYVDENGGVKTLSVKDQRKAVADNVIEREKRRVATDTRAPEVAAAESFDRQVKVFSEGGLEHPQWSQTLKAGVASMSNASGVGEITDVSKQGYALYKQLHAKTPNYLRTQLTGDEANVYEAARILEQTGVADPDQALVATQRFYADPTRTTSETAGLRAKQIKDEVAGLSGSFFGIGGSMDDFENAEVMNPEIQKLADVLVGAGGLDPKAAVTKAVESVRTGYQTVNGWAVKTSDRNVPANFGDLATGFLREWHNRFASELAVDFEDLSIAAIPNNSGAWVVVEKATGLPAKYGGDGIITLSNLKRIDENRREHTAAKAIEDNKHRNEPIFDKWGIKIGRPRVWWSPEDDADFKSK